MKNDSIIERVMKIKRLCGMQEERIRSSFSLSPAEFEGLCSLDPGERMLCRDFSNRMHLSASRGSRIIEKLIGKSLLKSSPCPGDRRALLLNLTERGLEFRERIEMEKRSCENRILANCSNADADLFRKTLDSLITILAHNGGDNEK